MEIFIVFDLTNCVPFYIINLKKEFVIMAPGIHDGEGAFLASAFHLLLEDTKNGNIPNTPISLRSFLEETTLVVDKKKLLTIANATGIIVDPSNNLKGYAFVVTPSTETLPATAIVMAHNFEEKCDWINFDGRWTRGHVYCDASEIGYDFKWIALEGNFEIERGLLTTNISGGDGAQYYWDETKSDWYITLFTSEDLEYMQRSDSGGVSEEGQSGGPRIDLTSSAVRSLLQGESEGLTMNAIFHVLSLFNQYSQNKFIQFLELFKAQFVDLQGLYINATPNPIQIGDVDPFGKGLPIADVRAANIFTDTFLEKHYARSQGDASQIAKSYPGRVTVIKISSQSAFDIIKTQWMQKSRITPSTVWEYRNGKLVRSAQNSPIVVDYDHNNKIYHMDGIAQARV